MYTQMSMDRSSSCNFISLNVKGIRDKNKRRNIFNWCKEKGGNIIFLQETFSTQDIVNKWNSMWEGKCIYSHGTNHSRGVMILIDSRLDFQPSHTIIDTEGRYIFIVGSLQGHEVVLGNVYFPVGNKELEQLEFLHTVIDILNKDEYKDKPFLMGGDFNMVRDIFLDYIGYNTNKKKSKLSYKFEDFLIDYNAIDIWRKRNVLKRQFTYRQENPFMRSRLDYWVISESLEEKVLNCKILPSISPDHSAIELVLKGNSSSSSTTKAGYWKFNNSLCNDDNYVKSMKEEISNLKLKLSIEIKDNRILWDYMKMEIRNFTSKYCKRKVKERRDKIARLEDEIFNLEQELLLPQNFGDKTFTSNLEIKRRDLNNCYTYINEGIKIRSRAPWYENGERETAYFKQLTDSNRKKSVISELKVEGNICSDETIISKEIGNFYSKLYAKSQVEIGEDKKFFPDSLPKLTEDQRDQCEGRINQGECIEVLKEMKLNKSPGNDGLSVEFYVTLWQVIGDLVLAAFNDTFTVKELSPSQKQAIITLIHKDGKDPMLINNYRPISLLNVDYTILTKILSKRIKNLLNGIVSVDQVGYLKERNIGDAIRLIEDMIFHTSNLKIQGFLLAIDFEKAFDSVSHVFLQKVLHSYGFGPTFCEWIKILYTNAQSCVFNGGKSTGYFKVERGVRQGDPLSPYLFILCIECLAHCIRCDNMVKGIRFGGTEIKQVLYADDMTIFVQDMNLN